MDNATDQDKYPGAHPFRKRRERKKTPDKQPSGTCNDQIWTAMTLLAKATSRARDEAKEPTASAERKAELEAWLERHEAEITARIHVSNLLQSRSRQWGGILGNSTAANERDLDLILAAWLMGARLKGP